LGFVHNEGAPLLHYTDPTAGIDVRLWWYKTTGRHMEGFFQGMRHSLPAFLSVVRPLVVQEAVRRERAPDATRAWEKTQHECPWRDPFLLVPHTA